MDLLTGGLLVRVSGAAFGFASAEPHRVQVCHRSPQDWNHRSDMGVRDAMSNVSENRLVAIGGLAALAVLAMIALVRAMEGPVDHVAEAVGTTLRGRDADLDLIMEFHTPWGLPLWVLIIDNAIGVVLLAIMFLGGLPVAIAALALRSFLQRHPRDQQRFVIGRVAPYCLVFQVSSLCLATVITAVSLVAGGLEPFMQPWTWYYVATMVVSIAAIPIWRRWARAPPTFPAIFNERSA